MIDTITLAWDDLALLYRLMGHRMEYGKGGTVPYEHAHSAIGYWAHIPIGQSLLNAKLAGTFLIDDNPDAWNGMCHKIQDTQVRVIAAFNDAAVQRRDITLL